MRRVVNVALQDMTAATACNVHSPSSSPALSAEAKAYSSYLSSTPSTSPLSPLLEQGKATAAAAQERRMFGEAIAEVHRKSWRNGGDGQMRETPGVVRSLSVLACNTTKKRKRAELKDDSMLMSSRMRRATTNPEDVGEVGEEVGAAVLGATLVGESDKT